MMGKLNEKDTVDRHERAKREKKRRDLEAHTARASGCAALHSERLKLDDFPPLPDHDTHLATF